MQILLRRLRALAHMRIFKVGVIGIIGLIIQTAIFEVLGIWLKLVPASTAALIGGEVAILCNFALNHKFSFKDRGHGGSMVMRLVRFHMVVAGSLFFQWLFVFITEQFTTDVILIHIAYFAGVGVGFLTNYAGYYFFVWRHPKKLPHAAEQSPPTF
jgi:putative flippase GtrA